MLLIWDSRSTTSRFFDESVEEVLLLPEWAREVKGDGTKVLPALAHVQYGRPLVGYSVVALHFFAGVAEAFR
jgi:hypothetical protein